MPRLPQPPVAKSATPVFARIETDNQLGVLYRYLVLLPILGRLKSWNKQSLREVFRRCGYPTAGDFQKMLDYWQRRHNKDFEQVQQLGTKMLGNVRPQPVPSIPLKPVNLFTTKNGR